MMPPAAMLHAISECHTAAARFRLSAAAARASSLPRLAAFSRHMLPLSR